MAIEFQTVHFRIEQSDGRNSKSQEEWVKFSKPIRWDENGAPIVEVAIQHFDISFNTGKLWGGPIAQEMVKVERGEPRNNGVPITATAWMRDNPGNQGFVAEVTALVIADLV
ncbi:hypothetical protein [Streptomyces sp. URMC 124]|uniref:hypothetical protein n=1 Tax=Streptomyces sp. URMC 124 TaxID=3423405 RepID=UPI003F1B649E